RDSAHLPKVGPNHAELHWEADRRPEVEAIHACPCLRQGAVGERAFEPSLHPFAGVKILGDNDDLGEVRIWQHGVKPKPEARRALPDICGRSEEHTSELQSHLNLVCRLLLEKKKQEKCISHY